MGTHDGQFYLMNLYNQESFEFQYFPGSIKTESHANWRAQETTIGMQPLLYANRSPRLLNVDPLWLDKTTSNESIKPEIDQLEELLQETTWGGTPPLLLAIWGDERFRGALVSLHIKRQFFTPSGMPLRAEIAIELASTDQEQRTASEYRRDALRRITSRVP